MPALIAMLAIMTVALMMALPAWKYLQQDDDEQELIFRGRQISAAISRFQRKNGNAFPPSLEVLVQGKFLRKAYADPMTKDGRWRILRPGEGGVAPGTPGGPGGATGGGARPTPTPRPTATPVFGPGSGGQGGPVAGVASLSTASSLRVVNGAQHYNQWIFAPNVPFIVGRQQAGPAPGGNQLPAQNRLRGADSEFPRVSR